MTARACTLALLPLLAGCPAPHPGALPSPPASAPASASAPAASAPAIRPGDEAAPDAYAIAVRDVWETVLPRTQACFETFVDDPRFEVHIAAKISIAADGGVSVVTLSGDRPLTPLLEKCLTDVIGGAHFPAPPVGRPIQLEVPINFVFER